MNAGHNAQFAPAGVEAGRAVAYIAPWMQFSLTNAPTMIETIAILGTGLIGGSMGLTWRQQKPSCTIIGYDRPEVLEQAAERGAITDKAADPAAAAKRADLVVLATPIGAVLQLMETIAPHLEPGTIVTDVASVKGPVIDQAQDVLPDAVRFIGGHPMAGAEHAGIAHASPLLFENAAYVLSPLNDSDPAAVRDEFGDLLAWIDVLGARPLVLSARQHDAIAASVSHVPQLLAVALVNSLGTEDETDPKLRLAAGGFRDMTRIASSPFDMWRDIFVGNQGAILDGLSTFIRSLQSLRSRLASEDLDALEAAFDDAHQTRAAIPQDTKGFLQPLADIYVEAEDQHGVLYRLTGTLHEAGLSIKDIELLKFREGTGGTFRLSFEDDAKAIEAVDTLTDAGYQAHRP